MVKRKRKATPAQLRALAKGRAARKRNLNSSSPIKYKRRTMAKRRTTKKRSVKRSSKVFGVNVAKMLSPILYGMGREKVSNYIKPYTNKIPVGAVSDEVGMYFGLWAAKKYLVKKAGVARDVLSVGQNIELARIGEAVINGEINLGMLGQSSAASTNGNAF